MFASLSGFALFSREVGGYGPSSMFAAGGGGGNWCCYSFFANLTVFRHRNRTPDKMSD